MAPEFRPIAARDISITFVRNEEPLLNLDSVLMDPDEFITV